MQWLGVKSSDITSSHDLGELEVALLQLTARDRRKAVKMLDSPVFVEGGPEAEWRRELQVMLMLGFKAEMEIFGEGGGRLVKYLKRKIIGKGGEEKGEMCGKWNNEDLVQMGRERDAVDAMQMDRKEDQEDLIQADGKRDDEHLMRMGEEVEQEPFLIVRKRKGESFIPIGDEADEEDIMLLD
jgi:hypothetical protein